MEENVNIQKFIDDIIKKSNAEERIINKIEKEINSYGAVQLVDGTVINIRYNFFFLEQMWQMYMLSKAFDVKEEKDEILLHTNGGIFDSGDVILILEDIRVLYRSQKYSNNSEEEKESLMWKTALINKHLDETIYGFNEFNNDEDEDEDSNLID